MGVGHYLLACVVRAEARTSYCSTDKSCYKVVLFVTQEHLVLVLLSVFVLLCQDIEYRILAVGVVCFTIFMACNDTRCWFF
jgi:hypothetical protein